ncbi:MAG: manganese efflux pump, partial [Alphaproteobacteria bacterium]
LTILLLALSLSVDTFAAALTQGAAAKRLKRQHKRRIAAIFTACAILAPALGYTIGSLMSGFIDKIDHWIAFTLLAAVGAHMAYNGLFHKQEEAKFTITNTQLFLTGVATNIDAVAVGIGLAFVDVSILTVCIFVGLSTIAATYLGLSLGKRTGKLLGQRAEVLGGAVLIILGTKILLQHLLA